MAAPQGVHLIGLHSDEKEGCFRIESARQATAARIPVLTANVTSAGSTATAWFGQDEYASGVVLAAELRKFLSAQNKHEGRYDSLGTIDNHLLISNTF